MCLYLSVYICMCTMCMLVCMYVGAVYVFACQRIMYILYVCVLNVGIQIFNLSVNFDGSFP